MTTTRLAIVLALPLVGCVADPIEQPGDGGSTTDDPATTATTSPDPTASGTTAGVTTSADGDTGTGSSSSGGGTAGLGEDCQLELQDCAEGLKCMPYSTDGSGWWNETACFPVDPEHVELGEPCQWEDFPWSGYDDCGPAAVCWDLVEEPGECKGLCQMEVPGDWDTLFCEQEGTVPYVGCQDCFCICEQPCDPITQGCDEGQACFPTGDAFFCGADASTDEEHGSPCEFINVCGPGLMCIDGTVVPGCEGELGCCSTFCEVDQPNTCPGAAMGEECVSWYEAGEAPEGYENLGICSLPM